VSSPEGLCAFTASLIGIKTEIAKHPCVEQGEIVTLQVTVVPEREEQDRAMQCEAAYESNARQSAEDWRMVGDLHDLRTPLHVPKIKLA
jgi:hypothetical protein